MIDWKNPANIARLKAEMARETSVDGCHARVAERMGVSRDAVQKACSRYLGRAEELVLQNVGKRVEGPTVRDTRPGPDAAIQRLVAALRKGHRSFEELCDTLDLSPSKARELIERAKGAGVHVEVAHDHVGITEPEPSTVVQELDVPATVGEKHTIAVISDTHLGSKYCMRKQLWDFVEWAYGQGVREILHPGDVLDGCYRHGLYELTHSGIEAQCRDLHETLPYLPGLDYWFVEGNHDNTFSDATGMRAGSYLEGFMRDQGRDDWHCVGNRGAFVKIHGATIELWHPLGGMSYAKSYKLQKHIEGYTAHKPQILLTGHLHQFAYIYDRGVHGFLCPTFQGSQSAFSHALGGWQAQGGLLLSWELTELGMIRNFELKTRFYYEEERPVELRNALDATAIPKAVARSGAVYS